ncbi:MAG: DNA-3-methyladenine glycosylase I [Succinivibrionaceae bacterium]|nr:DNA-3-methyladenine glycosylase I [Succinivibrionaceae bacterium]
MCAERCGAAWCRSDPLLWDYHDHRWCRPVHDDRELFALLILEGKQAGLSWATVLHREAQIRAACSGLDPEAVARYTESDLGRLMGAPGIIRNRRKLAALVQNARAFLGVQAEAGSFDAYLWGWCGGEPIDHRPRSMADIPAEDGLSRRLSADLRRRGFAFVGPTIVYSYLQAAGLINDHLVGCPCRGG